MTDPKTSEFETEFLNLKASYENTLALTETDTSKVVVLNFRTLQLLRIKSLQQELFRMQMRFILGGFTAAEYPARLRQLDEALSNYGQALRNYELLSQNTLSSIPSSSSLFGTPEELITTEVGSRDQTLLDRVLRKPKEPIIQYKVRNWTQFTQFADKAQGGDYILQESLQYRELDEVGRVARAEKHAFWERLTMALFGGIALMAPVLIMSLWVGRNIALVTCSIAVVLFALTLAFFASATSGKDILAATAAYAAVLVVFIGTSMAPATGSG